MNFTSKKIVVAMTGSIAAYKGADFISKLRKAGHDVRVIMTRSSLKFVGEATIQGLSGHAPVVEDFSGDGFMSHIELGKWCDASIVYPATAQSINSLASGTGQELLTSFFLAYDFKKPFLFAPAMNTRMLENPITQASITKLKKAGCEFLETHSGSLACGEVGQGRLIEPMDAIHKIMAHFVSNKEFQRRKILITAGGTRETIDGVRTLTNMSTGTTGANLADSLYEMGHQVLLLTNRYAVKPKTDVKVDTYDSFSDIAQTLRALSQTQQFDMILHAAAISDYSIKTIRTPEGSFQPGKQKMSSQHGNISIELERNEKLLPTLKDLFSPATCVVGFKLTSTESKEEQARAIFSLFTENSVDYVIHNDMNDINKGERKFLMTSKEGRQQQLQSVAELTSHVATCLEEHNREVSNDLMS